MYLLESLPVLFTLYLFVLASQAQHLQYPRQSSSPGESQTLVFPGGRSQKRCCPNPFNDGDSQVCNLHNGGGCMLFNHGDRSVKRLSQGIKQDSPKYTALSHHELSTHLAQLKKRVLSDPRAFGPTGPINLKYVSPGNRLYGAPNTMISTDNLGVDIAIAAVSSHPRLGKLLAHISSAQSSNHLANLNPSLHHQLEAFVSTALDNGSNLRHIKIYISRPPGSEPLLSPQIWPWYPADKALGETLNMIVKYMVELCDKMRESRYGCIRVAAWIRKPDAKLAIDQNNIVHHRHYYETLT